MRKPVGKATAKGEPSPPPKSTRGGRPEHVPTAKDRKTVAMLVACGTDQDAIAEILGISPPTLRKHYAPEIAHSAAKANAKMGGALFNKGTGGDVIAMIFWLKCRARWTERVMIVAPGDEDFDVDKMSDGEINARLAKIKLRRRGKS